MSAIVLFTYKVFFLYFSHINKKTQYERPTEQISGTLYCFITAYTVHAQYIVNGAIGLRLEFASC